MNMAEPIELIVGLGNPGSEYEHTRHNAGFWFVDQLAQQHGIRLSPDKKYSGLTGKGSINGHACWLLKPTTFMNRSGVSVQALANFYKLSPAQILVIHDELDLPTGVARYKRGGGHGGQNGLRDIISQLGNNKDFHRLRIGIAHPGDKSLVTGHVLGRPKKSELESMHSAIDEAIRTLPDALSGDMAKAMNRLHSFKG